MMFLSGSEQWKTYWNMVLQLGEQSKLWWLNY